jgi:hypothetical protein
MEFMKSLALAGVISLAAGTAVLAQDAVNEDCDAVAATETTDDDCALLVPPPGLLSATNIAFVGPAVGGLVLLLGLAAGGGGTSGTSDTQ